MFSTTRVFEIYWKFNVTSKKRTKNKNSGEQQFTKNFSLFFGKSVLNNNCFRLKKYESYELSYTRFERKNENSMTIELLCYTVRGRVYRGCNNSMAARSNHLESHEHRYSICEWYALKRLLSVDYGLWNLYGRAQYFAHNTRVGSGVPGGGGAKRAELASIEG